MKRKFVGDWGLTMVALLLACSCICLGLVAASQGWWSSGPFLLNLIVALASISFTVAVVDRILILRADRQHFDRLLSQMRSGDRALALWALRELDANGSLRNGSLRDENLRESNLEDTDLSDTNFSGADLQGACLRGAVLEGANLEDAVLAGADLRKSDLTNANLRHTRFWAIEDTRSGHVERALYYEWHVAVREANKDDALAIRKAELDDQTTLPDGSSWSCPSDLDVFTGKSLWIRMTPGVIDKYVDVRYEIRGAAGTRVFDTRRQSDDHIRETYTSDASTAKSNNGDSEKA